MRPPEQKLRREDAAAPRMEALFRSLPHVLTRLQHADTAR